MPRDPGPRATIGSVFLKASNHDLALAVLRGLFPQDAITCRDGGWIDVAGQVDLFVEPAPPSEVPATAGFGIRVADARHCADHLRGIPALDVGELFEVAPDVAGFTCRAQGLPELFIHE